MRKQNQRPQPLHLLFFPSTLIISLSVLFRVLLLNAELALPQGAGLAVLTSPCFASTNHSSLCSSSKVNVSFPFLTSDECHDSNSSFIISNSQPSNTYPQWPGFTKDATKGSPLPSTVVNLYTPRPAEPPYTGNSSYPPGLPFDPRYGYITLTWSTDLLLGQDVCGTLAPYEQISQFIPPSINLHGFAQSAFNFDSSNIILLFRCDATKMQSVSNLQMNSAACIVYENKCKVNKDESYNCYQYMTPNLSKELNLSQMMNASGCKQTMFFAVLLTWKPGLILLNWDSTGTDWLASTFQDCARCLSTRGGSCGYDSVGNFTCSCGTNCSSENTKPPSSSPQTAPSPRPHSAPLMQGSRPLGAPPMQDLNCDGGWMQCNHVFQICLGVGLSMVALVLAFLGFCYSDKISSRLSCVAVRGSKKVLRRLQGSSYRPNLSIILRELEVLTERPTEYSYSSIASATKSFSHVVGEGAFGVVYKGTLHQKSTTNKEGIAMEIAVKVLEIRSKHMTKQFMNEVGTIGRIHHVNVVRLLGFCVQEGHEMLVYEYVANGSLDKWLFAGKKGGGDEERILNWTQRYVIALGIARGLSYLHEECRHRIVHCDIKPENILLDEAMSPKIADFGISRLMGRGESQVVTLARGTPGYMAPEFWSGGESRLSTKFDVYSYGMVLLELMSGRRNFTHGDATIDRFPGVAFEAAMQGNMGAILDSRLGILVQASQAEDGAQPGCQILTAAFVALWCIQDHPASRPSMSEVVQYLEGTMAVSKTPPQPSISTTPPFAPFCVTSRGG